MKKIVFCIFCMLGTVASVSAQERLLKIDTVAPLQQVCAPIPLSHWSLGIKGGLSRYNMPPDAINESDRLKPMFGGVLDYTINPLIGFGLEYDFNDYSRPFTYQGTEGKLNGATNDFIMFGSVNISNVLVPIRTNFWRLLNIYGDVGGGIAFFHFSLNNTNYKYRESRVGKLGLNAEFTLSESVNVGLGVQYNQYYTKNMSDAIAIRNDDALIWSLGLRLKLGSSSLKHARNISLNEYSPEPAPIVITKTYLKGDTDELLNRVKAAEKENAATKMELNKLKGI